MDLKISRPAVAILCMWIVGCTGGGPTASSPPGVPARLVIRSEPGGARTASPLRTRPVVEVLDSRGDLVRDSSVLVSVAVSAGAVLRGTRTVGTRGGRAYFPDLVLEGQAKEYTLEFSTAGTQPVTSKPFVLLPPGRSTTDRPDDVQGSQLHVVYVLPADGADRGMDTTTAIAYTVAAAQNWLANQLGGRAFRLDTYRGALDVTFFRLSLTDKQMEARDPRIRTQIQNELRQAGLIQSDKLYLVYYDGVSRHACGGGGWPPHVAGPVAALYLKGAVAGHPSCSSLPFVTAPAQFPGYWEFVALHELFHTMGGVQENAPNYQDAYPAHVRERNDLMYTGSAPWILDKTTRIDVGGDDYLGTNVPPGVNNLVHSPYFGSAQAASYSRSAGPAFNLSEATAAYPPVDAEFHRLVRGEISGSR